MILTLIFLFIFVFGILIAVSKKKYDDGWEGMKFICCIAGGIGTIVCLLAMILAPIHIHAEIVEFNAVKITIEEARGNPDISEFEMATLQLKVIEKNEWLADRQFWAKNKLSNWFYPKKILDLKPIK